MTSISFEVPGKPQGKGRVRFSRRGKFVSTRTPEQTVLYENWIRLCFNETKRDNPIEGPVYLSIAAYFPIPASGSKKKRSDQLDNKLLPMVKPDLDNIVKVVMDALNGGAWVDDKQVVELEAVKLYGQNPRLDIVIEQI